MDINNMDADCMWQEISAKLSKLHNELVSSVDSIESLLIELNEKKTRPNFEEEIIAVEKLCENTGFEVHQVIVEEYRELLKTWQKKLAVVNPLLNQIHEELQSTTMPMNHEDSNY